MIQRIALRLFYYMMFPCAALVITFIWAGGPPDPIYGQIVATLFVVGLASFLTWLTLLLVDVRGHIAQK